MSAQGLPSFPSPSQIAMVSSAGRVPRLNTLATRFLSAGLRSLHIECLLPQKPADVGLQFGRGGGGGGGAGGGVKMTPPLQTPLPLVSPESNSQFSPSDEVWQPTYSRRYQLTQRMARCGSVPFILFVPGKLKSMRSHGSPLAMVVHFSPLVTGCRMPPRGTNVSGTKGLGFSSLGTPPMAASL